MIDTTSHAWKDRQDLDKADADIVRAISP